MTETSDADALRELALRQFQQNQIVQAEQSIQAALSIEPSDVSALVISAMIAARQQRTADAEGSLRKALEIEPSSTECLIVLSKLLASTRRLPEAITYAETAALLNPEDAPVWVHLADLLERANRKADSLQVLLKAKEQTPKDIMLLRRIAALSEQGGSKPQLLAALEELLQLDTRNLEAWLLMARTQLEVGQFKETLRAADKALHLDKRHPAANLAKALALSELGRGDESETYLRNTIKVQPENGIANAALGYLLQEQGKFPESLGFLEASIRLTPHHGFAFYNLLRAKKAPEVAPGILETLRTNVDSPLTPLRDRGEMHYALGKASEDLKDFESSIKHYTEGNKIAYQTWLSQVPWRREDYQDRFSRTIETFTQPKLAELAAEGLDTQLPLMIVGMMRSGTSLLEQILSSHPDVVGAGELPFWHDFEEEAYGDNHIPTAPRIRKLGERYLADLKKLGPKAKRITDKLPHNYAMLGLIHTAFPKAKIIHVKRSPADNCLSIYTTAYQRPPVFAHDRDNIVFAYKQYQRIIAHWREVLPPENFMEIQYEDLIADRDNLTRKLIEFSGLPWNDACLHHEKNERAVRTPSLWQVRQPIYTTSIARWKRYEPWIPEFTALLEESERQ